MLIMVAMTPGGVRWGVRFVLYGEPAFIDRTQVKEVHKSWPRIQFYDLDSDPQTFGPLGQFVREYDTPTIYRMRGTGTGLDLDLRGSVRGKIDAETMTAIAEWVRQMTRLTVGCTPIEAWTEEQLNRLFSEEEDEGT